MKKSILITGGLILFLLPLIHATPSKLSNLDKFYGKIIGINLQRNTLTVKNKKRKVEETFKWDKSTRIMFKKKQVKETVFEEGQNLIVYFDGENPKAAAKRITIRVPYSRASKKSLKK